MTWEEIKFLPSTITKEKIEKVFSDPECTGIHESVLRSFQLVQKIRKYLKMEVNHSVILEMMDFVEGR